MIFVVKAEFPIGKTQWAKWNNAAREAFNRTMRLGFEFSTAVAEANAVNSKGEPVSEPAPEPEVQEKTEKTEEKAPPAPKKPSAPKKSK